MLCFCALPLAAGEGPDLSSALRIESGWTSNAEGGAGGRPDQFLTLSHRLEGVVSGPGFELRGGFAATGEKFLRLDAENDSGLAADLSGRVALADQTALRGSIAFEFEEEGQSLGAGLASLTPLLRGGIEAELTHRMGHFEIAAGGGYSHVHQGESRFSGIALAPARLKAQAAMASAHLRLGYDLDAQTGVFGMVLLRQGLVPEADQGIYGRVPATLTRVLLGLRHGTPGRAVFTLEGGADSLSAPGLPVTLLPYGMASAELALTRALILSAGFSTDTLMADPADGLADWEIAARAGLAYDPAGPWRLGLALFAEERRSAGFDIGISRHWGAEARVETAVSDALAFGGLVRHKRVTGLAPAHEETRLSLWLEARL